MVTNVWEEFPDSNHGFFEVNRIQSLTCDGVTSHQVSREYEFNYIHVGSEDNDAVLTKRVYQ
jgi:hypothetical protein